MRRVLFTAAAEGHSEREREWWLANRDQRDAFADDLEQAVQFLALLPGIGTEYPAGGAGLRRVYLRRIGCHLYYTFDEHRVIVRALWGARRERGPAFG